MRAWGSIILAACAGGCSLLSLDELAEPTGGNGGGGDASVSSAATAGGDTSTGSASASGPGGGSSSSTTGAGGGCDGCIDDDGACQPGDVPARCGLDGATCEVCPFSDEECEEPVCDGGACGQTALPDFVSCQDGAGACVRGVCSAGVEICLNDEDDDRDGAEDCADDDCARAGYACTDPTTRDFSQPYLVIVGDAPARCPAVMEEESVRYATADVTCSCGEPELGGCEVSLIFTSAACSASVGEGTVDEACNTLAFDAPFDVDDISTAQTCTSAGLAEGSVRVFTLCKVSVAGGCPLGAACHPAFEAPIGTELLRCIDVGSPDVTCPASYPEPWPVSTEPELGCDCACSIPDDECSGVVETHDAPDCGGCGAGDSPCDSFPAPSALCMGVSGPSGTQYAVLTGVVDGEPEVTPGAVRTGGNPSRLCCQPL